MTPDPPNPFSPKEDNLPAGHELYRVHNRAFRPAEFNPGYGPRTRFAFFGDPAIPSLYAAGTDEAAIAETIFHDIPQSGGELRVEAYEPRNLSKITLKRDVRLASFMGMSVRQLKVSAADLTTTRPASYQQTVKWAEAAHDAGFDGVVYMSRLCNNVRTYAFFGDRVTENDFDVETAPLRSFNLPEDRDWLVDLCVPFHIDVRR